MPSEDGSPERQSRNGHEHQELPFIGVARYVTLAERVLSQHDGSWLAPTGLTVTRLELDPPGQPNDELPHGSDVPAGFPYSWGDPRETHGTGRVLSGEIDRRNPRKELHWNQPDVDISQMRFSGLVSVDAKAFHRSTPAGSEQERIET
jgi:hypothetical protein